jgi:hypothetical protein
MAMPEIVFRMPIDIPGSGAISGIDFFHAGSIYSIRNQENQPFWPISTYLNKFRFSASARDRIWNAG